MPNVSIEELNKRHAKLNALERERSQWRLLWRDLADNYLPVRYTWLLTDKERRATRARNEYILDGTGTKAARTLAAGMMNGITSPSRPWFKLRVPNNYEMFNKPIREYLDEVERRMLLILAESNFYNALQIMYLDLVVFGTSSLLIYEDFDSVIRCYNPCLGEYYLSNSYRQSVDTFARTFYMNVDQITRQFPDEKYWSETIRSAKNAGGARLLESYEIAHIIEPNDDSIKGVPPMFRYREIYWERKRQQAVEGHVLALRGYHEMPGIFPRWELTSGEAYGTSPAMDALGDVLQLQHETKRKGQGLDYMMKPPLVAPVELQHKPTALLPGGITYVSGTFKQKVEPAYTVVPPIDQISLDIQQVQIRIRETFHNELFNMISQLSTVRSATEIDARREEKLVMLNGVLERVETEALDPALERVFGIMNRAGLLPEPPPELAGEKIEIQYVSILSVAQRAVAAAPTERFLQLVGNLAAVFPQALNIPNVNQLVRDYGVDIGVKASGLNSAEEVAQLEAQKQQETAAAQALAAGDSIAQSAKNLSQTDVGGGASALQRLLG